MKSAFVIFVVLSTAIAGFGAAGTSPERMRSLLWRDTLAGAAVLSNRGSDAAEAVRRSVLDSSAALGRYWFPHLPQSAALDSSSRLPGYRRSREQGAVEGALARLAASPAFENLRLILTLSLSRLSRLFAYLLMSLPVIFAFAADGFYLRRVADQRLAAGRPSAFAGTGMVPLALMLSAAAASLIPRPIPEALWWLYPLAFGLALRRMAAKWHRLPR